MFNLQKKSSARTSGKIGNLHLGPGIGGSLDKAPRAARAWRCANSTLLPALCHEFCPCE